GDVSTQAIFCHSLLKDLLRVLRHCHFFDAKLRESVSGCAAFEEQAGCGFFRGNFRALMMRTAGWSLQAYVNLLLGLSGIRRSEVGRHR
ncbi:MAG: hypothetical protein ACK58J_04320, partial [Planctomyces sp.]